MFKSPFSFNGRIRRIEYGSSYAIYLLAIFITDTFLQTRDNPQDLTSNLLTIAFFIPPGWLMLTQGSKRCHDLGKPGWWQINPFYMLWMLFKDGEPFPNKYGENPKGINDGFNPDQFAAAPHNNSNDESNSESL
jgi:uncharacterized membrane protein YhaH (DUF805 family)